VTYAEGFAGPGVYKGGEPGSPVIALKVFLTQRDRLDKGKHLAMILVDEEKARIARLQLELKAALTAHGQPKPVGLHIDPADGTCDELLLAKLTDKSAFGQPIFAFLDSFGGPDVPYDVIKAVAANPSSEVLVTFSPTFLTRFGEVDQHRFAGDRAFGGTHWRAVADQPSGAKKAFLVTAYRQSLQQAGFKFTLTFEMIDESGHALFLIFGTSNDLGIAKMKDAMWTVDAQTGVRYRDPRDVDQTLLELELEPDTALLGRMLVAQIGDSRVSVEDLRRYTLLETVYRPEHVIKTVKRLVQARRLAVTPKGRITRQSVVQRFVDCWTLL